MQLYLMKEGSSLYEIQYRFAVFICLNGASIKMQKYLVGLIYRRIKSKWYKDILGSDRISILWEERKNMFLDKIE